MRVEGGNTMFPGPVSTGYAGGGARFKDAHSLTIDRVWFDRNSSGWSGGGLQIQQGSTPGPARITRSAFTRNYAVSDAGGLSLGQGTDISVSNSLIATTWRIPVAAASMCTTRSTTRSNCPG